METIKITKKDLDENNFYKYDGIGEPYNYEDANVEIEENLGCVKFRDGIYVSGSIVAKNNSGIEASGNIKAGESIEAGEGIVSLYGGIKAGSRIKVNKKCGIIAGIFSLTGEKDVEAQEIIGKVVYGNVKLLKSENDEKTNNLSGKVIKIELDGKTYEAVIN
jgi:uncharacterized protein (DUF2147 family)